MTLSTAGAVDPIAALRVQFAAVTEGLAAPVVVACSGGPDSVALLALSVDAGLGPVAVHVDSKVSLNGRPAAPMIDPDVDLLTIEDGLGRMNGILPAPDGSPPPTRPVR